MREKKFPHTIRCEYGCMKRSAEIKARVARQSVAEIPRLCTIRRLRDEIDTLRWSEDWRIEERERAFKLLGADDYPDGDLCDWISPLIAEADE